VEWRPVWQLFAPLVRALWADPCRTTARKRTAGKCESGSSTQTFRFDPSASAVLTDLGIPYQCFNASAWPIALQATASNWLVVCVQDDTVASTF